MYENITKKFLSEILIEGFSKNGLKVILKNSDDWDYQLPDSIKDKKFIVLDIMNWTLEESFVNDEGVFIKTAFGGDEYSKQFSFDDILQIVTFEGKLLYTKTFQFEREKSPKMELTSKPKARNSEGEKYSLQKMLEMNSHLKKYNKGL